MKKVSIKISTSILTAVLAFSFLPLAQAEEVQALVVDNGSGMINKGVVAVPEPGTLGLLAIGLGVLGLIRRKK